MTAPEVLAQRERDRKLYEAGIERGGMWAEIAVIVSDVITAPSRIGEVLNLVYRLDALFSELGSDPDVNLRVDMVGAHISTETVAYPNARVELDTVGNVVAVEFEGRVELS